MDVLKLTVVAESPASAEVSLPLSGLIQKVRLVFGNNPGASADATLSAMDDLEGEFIVNRQNQPTNVTLYPRRQVQDNAANPLTLDGSRPLCEPYAVRGRLKLSLQDANVGSFCTAWIWLTC